jgi:F-type H+-transporting ATPase subunit b
MTVIERITSAVAEVVEAALGVSLLDMFIQLAATVILVLIVRKFLWSKITDYLEKRREVLMAEVASADDAKLAAIQFEKDKQVELAELQRQKTEVLLDARKQGEQEREAIVEAARLEAARVTRESTRQLDHEIQKAKEALTAEVVSLAGAIAKKMIETEIDPAKYTDEVSRTISRKDA